MAILKNRCVNTVGKSKQYKLEQLSKDINKKVLYNKNDNILILDNESVYKSNSINTVRTKDMVISTLANELGGISNNNVKSMFPEYNHIWQYDGDIYGVKPGRVDKLNVNTRVKTNLYDVKGYHYKIEDSLILQNFLNLDAKFITTVRDTYNYTAQKSLVPSDSIPRDRKINFYKTDMFNSYIMDKITNLPLKLNYGNKISVMKSYLRNINFQKLLCGPYYFDGGVLNYEYNFRLMSDDIIIAQMYTYFRTPNVSNGVNPTNVFAILYSNGVRTDF